MTKRKDRMLLPREDDKLEDDGKRWWWRWFQGGDILPCVLHGSISSSYTGLTWQTSNRCFFLFPKAPSGPLSASTSVRLLSVQRVDSRQLECECVCVCAVLGRVGGATVQATPGCVWIKPELRCALCTSHFCALCRLVSSMLD